MTHWAASFTAYGLFETEQFPAGVWHAVMSEARQPTRASPILVAEGPYASIGRQMFWLGRPERNEARDVTDS